MEMSCILLVRVILLLNAGPYVVSVLVPALISFGDSTLDVGNNNHLLTLAKSNHPPYGRDFPGKRITGRFSNGFVATDYVASMLGLGPATVAYLDPEAKGDNIVRGVSFASGGSGFYHGTSKLYNVLGLEDQLKLYKQYREDLVRVELRNLGARRVAVASLPPFGCLPSQITLHGFGKKTCVEKLNKEAVIFNSKMLKLLQKLNGTDGMRLAYLDVFYPLYDAAKFPAKYGFVEGRRGCCGTGRLEASIFCNKCSIGTCANASKYVFWDSFHPSDRMNFLLAKSLFSKAVQQLL